MLSRRAEENAFSLRVKTNHRLPCSFSSWRLESPGRPHTARRLGMFAMQRPPHSGSGSAQVAASDPGPVPRSSPAPQQPSRGGGAAAPGGRVGEPQLQRPERLIAEDPSRAHPPPQPPPPWPWGRRARFMCPGPRGAGPGVGIAAGSSSCLSAATCVWSAPSELWTLAAREPEARCWVTTSGWERGPRVTGSKGRQQRWLSFQPAGEPGSLSRSASGEGVCRPAPHPSGTREQASSRPGKRGWGGAPGAEGSASSRTHFGTSLGLGSVLPPACPGGASLSTSAIHADLWRGSGPTLAPGGGPSGRPPARAGHARPQSTV
uniref:collagen alpha-1(I) chain-like isoform X1 n=1 Tax=Callithrix jacchus TaxID=9483 RepID=UPI0023DD5852|nr:collagen alpha-1(I) chain-like isoform X1 [Callithrix jacchus]XP_054096863.1 collagen alpha-1(I) chain-like isoform X1 [Callithrix jacchus]XP_054096864.1 collagen alpha-1(I) chain-like isoform X1 [Callithrix jacchus]XP_054096865.1 collagen alpha-1(I) chain-like isoform X1 [Callithrix jacchus]